MKNYFRKNLRKEPWQIAAARFCIDNAEKGFMVRDLEKYIKSLYDVGERHINQFYEEEIYKPAGRDNSRSFINTDEGGIWIPPLELVSKITDYDELKEARKNAKYAFLFSIIAIIVSVITLNFTVKQTNLTEIQSRSERILQAQEKQRAIEFCKENPQAEDSGLFYTLSGKPAPCSEVLKQYGD